MEHTSHSKRHELIPGSASDFKFDAPLILSDDSVGYLDNAESWQIPSRFPGALVSLPFRVKGLILPLELSVISWNRQDLLGYELLNALRWSSDDSIRGCPVLVAAWQDLSDVLRKKPDLLLIQPSIRFVRLPVGAEQIEAFLQAVRDGRLPAASRKEIEEAVTGVSKSAERVTYHDLANDYYAAYRMWRGYGALLGNAAHLSAKIAAEHELVMKTHFGWEDDLLLRLNSPVTQRYLASAKHAPAPRYPIIANSIEILAYHLEHGLPEGSRVLLVDDEFHKGFADVLLRILFRKESFTRQLANEWVYSEPSSQNRTSRWARFVCVSNPELARNWLAHWDRIEFEPIRRSSAWSDWLEAWMRELSPESVSRSSKTDESEEVFGANRNFILDQESAGPRIKSTIVLLDLRLVPITSKLYTSSDLPSYHIRSSIKLEKPDLPVIMFTASHQVLNAAEILETSGEIDGWFMKESPEISVDSGDENSANSVVYLLERIHLYSTVRGWYRDTFAWNMERKLAYARLFHSKSASAIFTEITIHANAIFGEVLAGVASIHAANDTFLAHIQRRIPSDPFPIESTLVARRVVIASLLWTADVGSGSLQWSVEAFASLLPGRPLKRNVKWIYDKLNFNQVLWMRSSDVLSQLLVEEIDWLLTLEWPENKQDMIIQCLQRVQTLTAYENAGLTSI